MIKGTSQHILNTSSQLLGFCLIVISSLHISNYSEKTFMDECITGVAVLLIISSVLSFASIKTQHKDRELKYEKTAENLFFVSLIGIAIFLIFLFLKSFNH